MPVTLTHFLIFLTSREFKEKSIKHLFERNETEEMAESQPPGGVRLFSDSTEFVEDPDEKKELIMDGTKGGVKRKPDLLAHRKEKRRKNKNNHKHGKDGEVNAKLNLS